VDRGIEKTALRFTNLDSPIMDHEPPGDPAARRVDQASTPYCA